MHICFIEVTYLHGGARIWVMEAVRHILAHGKNVTLLTPDGGWAAEHSAKTKAHGVTCHWDEVKLPGASPGRHRVIAPR